MSKKLTIDDVLEYYAKHGYPKAEKENWAIVVRCEDCAHNKMCGQVMEIFGKQYHVNWCSYGERRKN